MNKKTIVVSVLVFAAVGLAFMQIPVSHLAGSKATFTLFDAFAPMAGAILGGIPGILAVLLMQVVNLVIHQPAQVDIGVFIRLLPMLGAVWYFAKPSKWQLLIPALAILSFNLDPVGRSVWYFSLFWLIPVAAHFFRQRNLFLQSLGATFTAHAIGGALWIHAFHLPKAVWVGLIPVVVAERLMFAIGISVLYVAVVAAIKYLVKKEFVSQSVTRFVPGLSLN